jgi:hypothetical protein
VENAAERAAFQFEVRYWFTIGSSGSRNDPNLLNGLKLSQKSLRIALPLFGDNA